MKTQCAIVTTLNGSQCIGELGHPGPCVFNAAPKDRFVHVSDAECRCISCESMNIFWTRVMHDTRAALDAEAEAILKDAYPMWELTWGDSATIEENNVGIKPGTVIKTDEKLSYTYFPPGLGATAEMVDDPLRAPLYPIDKGADWSAKDRQIEWVRANFTPGMLAKLYKLSYEGDGLRIDKCNDIIKKG